MVFAQPALTRAANDGVSNRAPNTNSGPPVVVGTGPAGHRTVVVYTEARHPPAPGHAYWFVLEVHGVSGRHSGSTRGRT